MIFLHSPHLTTASFQTVVATSMSRLTILTNSSILTSSTELDGGLSFAIIFERNKQKFFFFLFPSPSFPSSTSFTSESEQNKCFHFGFSAHNSSESQFESWPGLSSDEPVFFRFEKMLWGKLLKSISRSPAAIPLPVFVFVFVAVAVLVPPEGEKYLVRPKLTLGHSL